MSLKKARSIAIRSLTPNKPHHAQWMLTRKCNFRCRGCNVWRQQDRNELSTEAVKRGLSILRDIGVVDLVLSGGNPLLRDDINEIVEYASQFFITTVYDNGSMALKKIDALRHADLVAISIDSLDPKKNDYVRGVKGAWRTAMQALEELHNQGVSVGVAPTISQYNLYEILDFTKYFAAKDIPVWYSLYSYDTTPDEGNLFRIGKKDDQFTIVDKDTMVKLCDSLIEMKKKTSNIMMTTKLLKAIKNLYLTGERPWECRAFQNFFMIDHVGRVAGCHLHDPTTTVFDLPSIWDTPELKALQDQYSKCKRCTYMCYIFYSLHGSVLANILVAQEQWKNARRLILRKKPIAQLRWEQRVAAY
ncbi:MAG TPA: radical SAM protein [Candidatus Eisenbacteria bacterium]|nr:radical SAM protein [Candidatus Eisenbacteria bacterium]